MVSCCALQLIAPLLFCNRTPPCWVSSFCAVAVFSLTHSSGSRIRLCTDSNVCWFRNAPSLAHACRATNFPPEHILSCHNESSYNPLVPRRIGLLCLEPALQGEESLLARNADLTAAGPPELMEFVRQHGGLRYTRVYPDKHGSKPIVRSSSLRFTLYHAMFMQYTIAQGSIHAYAVALARP